MKDKEDHLQVVQLLQDKEQNLEFDSENIEVLPERILKGLGMTITDADPYLCELIVQLTLICKKKVEAKAGFVVLEMPQFTNGNLTLLLSMHEFQIGKIVGSFLKKSTACVLFSCTCGYDIGEFSRKLMKEGNGLEGLIADLIGSELAEGIAENLHRYIEEQLAGSGWGATNRYSPGYCNWPVTDQHKLFALLGEQNCGITLTASSLMIPVKSISGLIGIGPGMKRMHYKCHICKDAHCIMRGK